MASSDRGYWSRSWELLTRDEGWIKPVLVLAAARFVPIAGAFGADGYALEWARLTSWGVDSSPKQKGVDVSACIRSGAKAFVVSLGYFLALGVVRWLVNSLFGNVLGSLVAFVLTLAVSVVVAVAQLRATIYQTIGAGYQLNRIFDMVERDYKGLLRITGLVAVMALVLSVLISLATGVLVVTSMGGAIAELARAGMYDYVDEWTVMNTVLSGLAAAMPVVCVLLYGTSILHTITSLITMTSVGLWMRQFDVTNWGESSDPLPTAASPSSAPAAQYPGLPATHATTPQDAETTSYPAGQPAQTMPEPVASADEAYGYGSRAGSWDDARAEAISPEASPATEDAPDIPILPIESFEERDAAVPTPSEPETFDLQPTDAASSAEASDVPETFGLWGVVDSADAAQDGASESSEQQEADASLEQTPSGDVSTFGLQDVDSPAAEDSSVDSMPLDSFGFWEEGQVEAADEDRPSEVESFPLFDTPEPTDTFPLEESSGDLAQGEMPPMEEPRPFERRHNDEPLTEEEVLRRTEEAIRASDMTAWDIPQTAQPTGSVDSFDLDDFVGDALDRKAIDETPEDAGHLDAVQDEPEKSQFEQFVDAAIDSVEAALREPEPVVEHDDSEDEESGTIVESIRLSGAPDESPDSDLGDSSADTEDA